VTFCKRVEKLFPGEIDQEDPVKRWRVVYSHTQGYRRSQNEENKERIASAQSL
jgi:hypothetical protein